MYVMLSTYFYDIKATLYKQVPAIKPINAPTKISNKVCLPNTSLETPIKIAKTPISKPKG
ncbi:hypothetical protein GCM10028808_38850 [Spirosoma migulaei]